MSRTAVLTLLVLLGSLPARAHLPLFADASNRRMQSALALPDAKVSRVVYAEAPCGEQELWLSFEARSGDSVLVQLGVPRMDELRTYRPAIELLGPGLPPAEGRSDVAAGLGVALIEPLPGGAKPFYEMFSNTNSWILVEQQVSIPADGRYLLRAFDPEQRAARFWVAVGVEERFDMPFDQLADALERVKEFHLPPDDPAFGANCEPPGEAPSGCAAAGASGAGSLAWFMFRRRRRALRAAERAVGPS